MKNLLKTATTLLLALCLLVSTALPAGAVVDREADCSGFSDVPEAPWYRNYLDAALKRRLFFGTSEETFEPDRPITKAEAVTVLYRLDRVEDRLEYGKVKEQPFLDVSLGRFYTAPLAWAKDRGLVSGDRVGKFHPKSPMTQESLAVLISNYLYCGRSPIYPPAADADLTGVSEWAKEAVRRISGYDLFGSRWDPQAVVTRAQAAAIFLRLSELESYQRMSALAFRKYRYECGPDFHLLDRQAGDGLYYSFLETYEEFLALAEQLDSRADLAAGVENGDGQSVYGYGDKLLALEVQEPGSPQADVDVTYAFFIDSDGALESIRANIGGGDPGETVGFVFLVAVPEDTVHLCYYEQTFTGDFNGAPLPEGYPIIPWIDLGQPIG